MFISINIYFRPYEFLCSSLSFWENGASIVCINKCHFGVVKKVSVSSPIFISVNLLKNDSEITTCQLAQSCVNEVCIS